MEKTKIKIKKSDTVIMLTGKDRGKKGKVNRVSPKKKKVLVEGLNLVKKSQKPKKQGEKGEIISMPRAIDISNVAIYCSHCGKGTRVGYLLSGDKKIRICKKCQQAI